MEKTRNLFNTKKVTLLSRSEKQDYGVYMEAITEDIEHSLDKMMNIHGSFTFVNKNGYKILSSAVYLYGEVDLTNKKDIQYIERYKKAILNPYQVEATQFIKDITELIPPKQKDVKIISNTLA